MTAILRQLAYEVNYVSNGDRVMLLSSDFNITSAPQKTTAPVEVVSNLKTA